MSNNKIIKRERQEVPELIDTALLVKAAAGQENGHRVVVHRNTLGVAERLHRKMHQLLVHLSDSFSEQMKSVGIDKRKSQRMKFFLLSRKKTIFLTESPNRS